MHCIDTSILSKLSTSHPADAAPQKTSTRDISIAVHELLCRKFNGLAESELMTDTEDFILISPTQLAYFLRTLLKFVDGSAYLRIFYERTEERFIIKIEPSHPINMELSKRAALCSAAVSAGFDVDLSSGGISLYTDLLGARHRVMSIYEKLSVDLGLLFETVFFEL